jgi:phage-related protein
MMTRLKNAAITLGDSIGKTLGPWLEKLIGWVKGAVEWFNNLSPGMQQAIIVVGVLVAALGPLLLILGQLSLGLSGLIGLLPVLGTAFTAMTGPIGIIIAAIAGLIAIGVAIWKNWDTIREKAAEIWGAITDFFKGIWEKITGIFKEHWDKILAILFPAVGLPILIARNWGVIKEKIKEIWEGVINFFKKIPERIGQIFNTIKDIALAPFRFVAKGIESAINWIIRQINKISVDIPDWVPLIGGKHFGFDIPEISLPKFGKGGLIDEPTLLYGLKSKRPYAIAGEEGTEVVSPAQPVTITNEYNIQQLIVREEADVKKVAEELFRMQEKSYRALGISTA